MNERVVNDMDDLLADITGARGTVGSSKFHLIGGSGRLNARKIVIAAMVVWNLQPIVLVLERPLEERRSHQPQIFSRSGIRASRGEADAIFRLPPQESGSRHDPTPAAQSPNRNVA